MLIRKGPRSRFLGVAFRAADSADVLRLAEATGRKVTKLPESVGGVTVDLVDPNGQRVRVVSDTHELAALPAQVPLTFNVGHQATRTNATQRPPREPATVQRLGHVVLQTTTYRQTLDWYLEHLGLIVSDFLYYRRAARARAGDELHPLRPRRDPDRPPHAGAWCSARPTATCTPPTRSPTSTALAAGGEYLREQGYRRSWGIGRHIQGSQIFDYWRDPDGFLVEHYADGDLFDCTLEPGWAPMTASGLAQWGPPATKDFLGIKPGPQSLAELRAIAGALRARTTSSTYAACAAC